jgi:osmoprotectant transport system ATP-binding protein
VWALAEGRGIQASSIRFVHVSKRFGASGPLSVDSVDLEISPGRFVVLLGPSGCGKTTLLKMVNRLVEPTDGQILVDDVDVQGQSAPALRRRIGYVIQATGLFPHLRIEQNIAVVPKLLGWRKEEIRDRTTELLHLVGLEPARYRRRYPRQLSGGEQQRVGLARALAARPGMLLMDEPFGALDAITRTRLQSELRRIHAALRPTILFVTHDIEEAVRLADEIVVMRHGRIVQHASPLEIVLRPADDFVSELVGAGDVLRRLSLIPAGAVARPLLGSAPRLEVAGSATLRDVLGLLLESGEHCVCVTGEDGSALMLDLDAIQAASVEGWQPAVAAPV